MISEGIAARILSAAKIGVVALGIPSALAGAWGGWHELQALHARQREAEQLDDLNARILRCQVETLKRKVFGGETVDINRCYQIAVEQWRASN